MTGITYTETRVCHEHNILLPVKEACPWCTKDEEIRLLKAALKLAVDTMASYLPFLHHAGACNHDDPTWCDEYCGDYGKRMRTALYKITDASKAPSGETK